MRKKQEIRSLTGSTISGSPLGSARAPSDDLKPWLNWLSVSDVELPADHTIECGMLCDLPCLRLIWGGKWTAEHRDGHDEYVPGEEGITLYFGAQTRLMPLTVTGSFKVITLQFSVGASILGGPSQSEILDRILDYDQLVGHGKLTSKIPLDRDPATRAEAIENQLRLFNKKFGPEEPSALSRRFERTCLAGPDFSLARFAEEQEVSLRTLERTIKRDFGLTPQVVQRRARALDIAASMLGVVLPEEEAAMGLRYYDQSHQNRELRKFFGMTPGDLVGGAHPLMRLTLESRQKRRLEVLHKLGLIDQLPWRDPKAEPRTNDQTRRLK